MAAICDTLCNQPPDGPMVLGATVSGALVSLTAAAIIGAPILIGTVMGALASLISVVAFDVISKVYNPQGIKEAIAFFAIQISSSLAVAGLFVLLGASVSFAAAAFVAFIGLALIATTIGVLSCCGF